MASSGSVVNVRLSDASTFSVTVELTNTVLDLKRAIEPQCTPPCPPELQKLVYKGRILKDGDTLESYGLEAGHTVHLVKSRAAAPPTDPAPAAPAPAAAPPAPAAAFPGAGGGGGMPGFNPAMLAAMMGGMGGGAPGGFAPPSAGGVDPSALLGNPALMGVMGQMMAQPGFLESVEGMHPGLGAMLDAQPGMREMLRTPGFMASMLPMMQGLAGAQGGGGGLPPGAAALGGGGGLPGFNPAMLAAMMGGMGGGAPAAAPPAPAPAPVPGAAAAAGGGPGGLDLAALMQMMQGGGGGGFPGGFPGAFPGVPPAAPAAPARPPAEVYATQLAQMAEMGFTDTARNVRALQAAAGNVNVALERLFDGRD